jgi:2-keto-4-pentenoate hydratase/2-oxohepta-3-ene-1,7-dioic acid hydratase in catechol pathway
MRYVRYQLDEYICWGVIEQAGPHAQVGRLSYAPWHRESQPTGEQHELKDIKILAPVKPSKIAAVGRNYADHAGEMGATVAQQPRIFFKPPSAVIGTGANICMPPENVTQEVHYEAELAVVIGTRCRTVSPDKARSVVFGYTCANDVTARDIQCREGLPDYAKSFDTFCPLGPWLETELDLTATRVRCMVNGELKQDGHVADMLVPVPELVSYISQAMTLLPGDVILTGTPAGVGKIVAGDEAAVEIEGVGRLVNRVVAA